MSKPKKKRKKILNINKLVKTKIRESFKQAGGLDGRYKEQTVPDKTKKYNRQQHKKIKNDEDIE